MMESVKVGFLYIVVFLTVLVYLVLIVAFRTFANPPENRNTYFPRRLRGWRKDRKIKNSAFYG